MNKIMNGIIKMKPRKYITLMALFNACVVAAQFSFAGDFVRGLHADMPAMMITGALTVFVFGIARFFMGYATFMYATLEEMKNKQFYQMICILMGMPILTYVFLEGAIDFYVTELFLIETPVWVMIAVCIILQVLTALVMGIIVAALYMAINKIIRIVRLKKNVNKVVSQ